jgi:hypothetical protein
LTFGSPAASPARPRATSVFPSCDQRTVTGQHLDRVRSSVDLGIEEGAKLVVDGRGLKLQGYENGFFLGGCLSSGPISVSGSVPGPVFSARTRSPAQGFGYAVMNVGLGSGGSMIHTEMMQGFRPSGVTSEQRTSNFWTNGLPAWLVTGLFCGWFNNAILSSARLPGENRRT